jgi:serine protease
VVRLGPRAVARIAERARKAEPDLCSLHELAEGVNSRPLRSILRKYPAVKSHPVVRRRSVAQILDREASRDTNAQIPSLAAYFIADPRDSYDPEQAGRLLLDLRANQDVEVAYREATVRNARTWVVDPTDPFVKDQGYLEPAPKGIGANTEEVWGYFNGAGVRFVDLEAGWNLEHVDLPQHGRKRKPLINRNDPTEADHGTAVLGVVLGQRDGGGITGIAPKADFRGVVSHVVNLRTRDPDVPDAIEKAVKVLGKGGVLLLEVQTGEGYPIEVDEVMFTAIWEATRAGVIVIEAGGNGTETVGRDLSRIPRRRRDDPPPVNLKLRDSGAIMVSACRANFASQGGHRRIRYASYGSRINCYAWGESVVTAGWGDFGPIAGANRSYTDSFGGTSAAAAIIAGAAILVQQMASAPGGPGPLDPTQMRRILSDPTTGTVVLAPTGKRKIGVMPDLEQIARRLKGR